MGLLIAIFIVVISTSHAAKCPPGEYVTTNVCCPMCHMGTVVKTHCTLTSSSSVCIPCVEGTYMDHPNGMTECLKCTECDIGAGLVEKKRCTYTSNTECECKPGYFCIEPSCDLCLEHKVCFPGQYVKVQGTPKRDNECEDCPPGHFSAANMSETCTAWTDCDESGRRMSVKGTAISDTKCNNGRNHFVLVAAVVVIIIFIISLLTFSLTSYRNRLKKQEVPKPRHNSGQPEDSPEGHCKPVQETNE